MGLVGYISVYGGNSKRPTCYSRPGGILWRKHPDMFRALRETTRMLGPCCLCPLLDKNGPDYVKAMMYMATVGPYTGQYVISCASDKCGYFGKSSIWSCRIPHSHGLCSLLWAAVWLAWYTYKGLWTKRLVFLTWKHSELNDWWYTHQTFMNVCPLHQCTYLKGFHAME